MIIWLASYPRSGNTLLRLMLKRVFNLQTCSLHHDADDIAADARIAEQVGHQKLSGGWPEEYQRMTAAENAWLVKTHEPPADAAKAIYIVRDGRASCRSFYHYLQDFPHLASQFSLRDVIAGFTPFGSWSDHLDDWNPQHRPDTLLLKYEELVEDPETQIIRLQEFLQTPTTGHWKNHFQDLHEINPRFFRAGKANDPDTALTEEDAAIFFQQHGPWMQQLGYPVQDYLQAPARAAYRRWISKKGRDFYNLSERVVAAEVNVRQIAETADQNLLVSNDKWQTQLQEAQQREARLADQLQQAAVDAQRRESEHSLQLQQKQLEADAQIQTIRSETEIRLAEGRALVAQQLEIWNGESIQLNREVRSHRERSTLLTQQNDQQQLQLAELKNAITDASYAQREIEEQLASSRRQLSAEHSSVIFLGQQIVDLERLNHIAQREFAAGLYEKTKIGELLAAAVVELNTRLRMLLTSRLLHIGWKLGLGSTPYWDDPKQDELTPLIDQVSLTNAAHPQWKQILSRMGAAFTQTTPDGGNMDTALEHLRAKGFAPKVVLDVGAGKGYWTLNAAWRFKEAEFYMIDPLPQSEPDLQKICQDPRFKYLRCAVGDEPGELRMNITPEPDSSSLLEFTNADPDRQQTVSVQTIDQLLDAGQIKLPDLVKIDVQGFELKALRGASKLYEHAEVFIIEGNLFEFMPGCPRLHELIGFMAEREFYPFDFAGFLRRPFQNDLGQLDIVFVSQRSPMVASNRWLDDAPVGPAVAIQSELVSVIICTKDPRPDIFSRALEAINQQTLSRDRFELVIVDNASQTPLEPNTLKIAKGIQLKVVQEPVVSLSRSRCTGIANASGDMLVFVDDDNFLAPDYLENAMQISRSELKIGVFGGITEVELEAPVSKWKRPILPYMGIRDHGNQPITRLADYWGEWEPIGAGMVARRVVAERFVSMFKEISEARLLGRSGSSLLSGEDALFARAAYRAGFACSYQPALRLTHYIKSSRLKVGYMCRLLEGHGRSYVLLHRAMGQAVPKLKMRTAIARLLYRLRDIGVAGFITWRWDIGYAREFGAPTRELASENQSQSSMPFPSVEVAQHGA